MASGLKNGSVALLGTRSTVEPKAYGGLNSFATWLGVASTRMVCAILTIGQQSTRPTNSTHTFSVLVHNNCQRSVALHNRTIFSICPLAIISIPSNGQPNKHFDPKQFLIYGSQTASCVCYDVTVLVQDFQTFTTFYRTGD